MYVDVPMYDKALCLVGGGGCGLGLAYLSVEVFYAWYTYLHRVAHFLLFYDYRVLAVVSVGFIAVGLFKAASTQEGGYVGVDVERGFGLLVISDPVPFPILISPQQFLPLIVHR